MAVWWDGDLLRELLNKNVVSKYDWEAGVCKPLVTFEGVVSNNGTKATPCLQGDILGDWREEVLLRTEDNTALRLYVSPIATDYRFHTFPGRSGLQDQYCYTKRSIQPTDTTRFLFRT